ncbi:MAG: MFS transporter [Deltaproteobacteria bacterium]|nr:MFS transporter [Deltaproteobacteria bacterium]
MRDREGLLPIARWFDRNRGLAFGLSLSGTGIGTLLLPPLANGVIATASWRVAFQVFGLLSLVLILGAGLLLKPKPAVAGATGRSDEGEQWNVSEALRTRTFWSIGFTNLFCCFSHSIPLVHIAAYATDLGATPATGALLLAVIGGVSIGGRVLWGLLADRFGPGRTLVACLLTQTTSILGLALAPQFWMLYLFAGGLGLAYGGVYPLYATAMQHYFGNKSLGGIYGYFSTGALLGMGLGGFLGGRLFDLTGSYLFAFLVSTSLGAVAVTLAALTRRPLRTVAVPAGVVAVPA